MCMMAVVALAFTACKKNETEKSVLPLNATFETLTVENESGFEKVYLDNGKVKFESGDAVALFNIKANPTTSEPSQVGVYTVQPDLLGLYITPPTPLDGTTDGNYYAFYPGGAVSGAELLASNRSTFTLEDTQIYPNNPFDPYFPLPNNCLYMAAKDETATTLTTTVYNFKNICGILALNLYSPSGKSVKSIEVTDKKFNIVGDVTLRIDRVDPAQLTTLFNNYSDDAAYQAELQNYLFGPDGLEYSVANASPTVTLNCGSEGVELGTTAAEATRFFIVMRPLALTEGCDIVITFTDESTHVINSVRNNVIKPNRIRNMSPVSVN